MPNTQSFSYNSTRFIRSLENPDYVHSTRYKYYFADWELGSLSNLIVFVLVAIQLRQYFSRSGGILPRVDVHSTSYKNLLFCKTIVQVPGSIILYREPGVYLYTYYRQICREMYCWTSMGPGKSKDLLVLFLRYLQLVLPQYKV